uniref:MarR family transcriptional regulator n=1 Tax=uncultured Megasphaera sp. TaxID=165188 RepID=UPI0025F6DD52
RDYHLSQGKLRVMIVMHQNPDGIAPSRLAAKTGVTRATITTMVKRMVRDGLAAVAIDQEDKRGKKVSLTFPCVRPFWKNCPSSTAWT